jgi:hypothetical protein
MPQEALPKDQQPLTQRFHITLNTDGRTHPRENSLAVAAIVFGVVAFALGWVTPAHLPASIIGIIGFPLALYSQMISATTGERWLNVIGMIGSVVGLALAISHGGFSA